MAKALQLAQRGIYTTHPNPRVGCVIVAGDKVVGEGWHQTAGEAHAEIIALKQAGRDARNACLYVTLEPCSHHGRTPPCANAIIKSGVSRVVIAMTDPNPLVDHAGISAIEAAGIEVTTGVCQAQAEQLNRGFVSRMTRGKPWVTLKIAISLDGKTAMTDGESQWITSLPARKDAHRLRASSSAIITGVGTVLRDDPSMTARVVGVERQPLRVILDTNLSTPPEARILNQPGETLIMTVARHQDEDLDSIFGESVEVIITPEKAGRIDLHAVLEELARREVNSLMLEAGSRLSGSMLSEGLVDELVVYMAPSLLGTATRGMFDIPGLNALQDRLSFEFTDVRQVGSDLRLHLIRS